MASKLIAIETNEEALESVKYKDHGKIEALRSEVLYNGWFYEVTEFANQHPGGNVIRFYTKKGEDATQAIEQFHFRSFKKVVAMLKTLKRRPALPQDRGLEPKALSRHEAFSTDFKKLSEELEAEGYFKPSVRHVLLRLLECFSMTLIAYGFVSNSEGIWWGSVAVILLGFSLSRFGWIMHEGGHASLTGNVTIDRGIQDICLCLMLGSSSKWWNSQHIRHHAMAQRLHHDVDLATLPFVAFHKRTVRDKKEINKFFIKYQHIFYWTLDLLFASIIWKFFLHPRYQIKKRAWREIFLCLPTLYLVYYLGPLGFCMLSYFVAFFLGINFALNHSHLEVTDEPTHWIEYAMTHTANITSNMFIDYWMGYLNYQIEHHLFPTMPQFRQKEISHRVKELAEKHGLPYRVFSYTEACKMALKNLENVGKELTSNNDNELQGKALQRNFQSGYFCVFTHNVCQ